MKYYFQLIVVFLSFLWYFWKNDNDKMSLSADNCRPTFSVFATLLVALQDLQHLKQTVHSRIYSVDGSFKPDFDIDFGFSFNFNQASAYCIEK